MGCFICCFHVGNFLVVLAIHAVDEADDDEDSKGNNQEIDDVLDEVSVGDMSDSVSAEDVGYVN